MSKRLKEIAQGYFAIIRDVKDKEKLELTRKRILAQSLETNIQNKGQNNASN